MRAHPVGFEKPEIFKPLFNVVNEISSEMQSMDGAGIVTLIFFLRAFCILYRRVQFSRAVVSNEEEGFKSCVGRVKDRSPVMALLQDRVSYLQYIISTTIIILDQSPTPPLKVLQSREHYSGKLKNP